MLQLVNYNILKIKAKSKKGNMIQDTDIWIYSFPIINQYILLKMILKEEKPKTQEKGSDVITKENDLFCIKSSYFELYLQIFEEDGQL